MATTRLLYSFTPFPNHILASIGGDSPVESKIDLLVMIENRGGSTDVQSIEIVIPAGGGESSGGSASPTDGSTSPTGGSAPSSGGSQPATPITPPRNPSPELMWSNPFDRLGAAGGAAAGMSDAISAGSSMAAAEAMATKTPAPAAATPDPPSTAANRLSDHSFTQGDLQVDTAEGWDITVSGGTITLTPKPPNTSVTVSSTIKFWIKNIKINEASGIVPLTITERAPTRIVDADTHWLEKLDAEFPVKDFYAEYNGQRSDPPVVYDLKDKVTLKWLCSTQGEGKAYHLQQLDADWHSDGVNVSGGGTNRQDSPPLRENTTFALQILDPNGVTTDTVNLTVRMNRPKIDPSPVTGYFKNRVLRLHWLASNAVRCSVDIDGRQVADNAPIDTYDDDNGFFVEIAGPAKDYEPEVRAVSQKGRRPELQSLGSVTVGDYDTIPTFGRLVSLAITPDGTTALGTDGGHDLTLIDYRAGTSRPISVATPEQLTMGPASTSGVAITHDGKTAVVLRHGFDYQNVGMLPNWDALLISLPDGQTKSSIRLYNATYDSAAYGMYPAITVDGNYALVADGYACQVSVINLRTLGVENTISFASSTRATAVTPDGRLALVCVIGGVAVIGLSGPPAAWAFEPQKIPMDSAYQLAIDVSSDSKVALVVNDDGMVSVVDIPNRRTLPPVTGTGNPTSIAITTPAAGQPEIALVANQDSCLTVLSVAHPQTKMRIPLGPGYEAGPVVISKNGKGLVATNQNNVIKFTVDDLPPVKV